MHGGPRGAGLPPIARWLGYAGLLPQIAAVTMVASGDLYWHFAALALAYAYAALILSFSGGLWWGLAARSEGLAPKWMWAVAVAPSLIALISAVPWTIGAPWPEPSLGWLGLSILGSLLVDFRFQRIGLAPAGWMALRAPLAIGLGLLTLAAACF
jgi:hypothetical protein